MKFGRFDDANREYVIDTPQTPYPWINYLGNEKFFSLISNTAGGYAFYTDARLRRLTRYRYNDVPLDNNGRYFYIKDGRTVWSPSWKPAKTPLDPTPAATASATRSSTPPKTASARRRSISFPTAKTPRSR